MGLTAVRDLREVRELSTPEDFAAFEVDLFAEFVLARASAGVKDGTIGRDVTHLEKIREWFDRPLFELEPTDADAYFGGELRQASPSLRSGRAQSLATFFQFLELRHKVEIYNLTGRVVECPLDEMNRPKAHIDSRLRVPPTADEVERLLAGWRDELESCRKYATTARNYTIARLIADIGLRINEVCTLDLADVHWELGTFGKLNVRFGKGSRRRGPKQRMAPLINGADRTLAWFVEDVWALFGDDHTRFEAPLFPSERKHTDGSCKHIGDQVFRDALTEATEKHLPTWAGRLTPHVLRHYAASQLYLFGMDLLAIQALLGHAWLATTVHYIHVQQTHIEDAWTTAHNRTTDRWKGLQR